MSLSPAKTASPPLFEPVLVPHWIVRVLDRTGTSLSQATDLNALAGVLGTEDLAMWYALNADHGHWVWGAKVPPTGFFATHWARSPEIYAQVQTLAPTLSASVQARLFDVAAAEGHLSESFSLRQSITDALLVIVNPGHFATEVAPIHRKNLVREVMRLSTGLRPLDEVARSPLFALYLKDL